MPNAVVLAGGRPDPGVAGGVPNKAFAPLLGRSMVEFVLDALRGAAAVRRIALVGPMPLPPSVAAAVDVPVPERGALIENLAAGLAALPDNEPVLAVGADIPLLTPAAVDAFAAEAAALDAEIVYGIVRREEVARAFPTVRKTFVRLRDGTFTGGSLILMSPTAFARARGAVERAIRARKRPWELAGLFGLGTLAGLAAGTLRIAALERRGTTLTGVRVRALVCPTPEIAVDVDTAEMLALVRERLGRDRGTSTSGHAQRIAGW
ncbi:MAG TPA: nucleotidyltransferase family protein [bacterium]|nr:nucleotidyltransferase family protein [bacterium]